MLALCFLGCPPKLTQQKRSASFKQPLPQQQLRAKQAKQKRSNNNPGEKQNGEQIPCETNKTAKATPGGNKTSETQKNEQIPGDKKQFKHCRHTNTVCIFMCLGQCWHAEAIET
jgi:hypothetical protein